MEPTPPTPPAEAVHWEEIAPGVSQVKIGGFPVGYIGEYGGQFQTYVISPIDDPTLDQAVSRIVATAIALSSLPVAAPTHPKIARLR